MTTWTVGAIAKAYEQAEPGFPRAYAQRHFIHLASADLVRPSVFKVPGDSKAAGYNRSAICAAYLLSILSRTGIKAATLKDVAERLRSTQVIREPGKPEIKRSFGEAIADVENGGSWFVVVGITPRFTLDAVIVPELDVAPEIAGRRGAIVLDCAALLRPLLSALADQKPLELAYAGDDDGRAAPPDTAPDDTSNGGLSLAA